jgi:uncharacterized OB-fold protein
MPMFAAEGPDHTFQRLLSGGRFMIQRSASTGKAVFPPRVMAPGSGETDLEWVEASGRGVIHSFTIVSQRPPRSDYNLCLIDLEEGPRLMSRVLDIPNDQVAIGLAVEAVIADSGEEAVLMFRPAYGASA